MSKRSKVWKYFDFKVLCDGAIDKSVVVCKLGCGTEMKYYGNTTNLARHLNSYHLAEISQPSETVIKVEPQISYLTQEPSDVADYLISQKSVPSWKQEKIKLVLAEWITNSERPIDIVEDDGLNELVKLCLDNTEYRLPSRVELQEEIMKIYDENRRKPPSDATQAIEPFSMNTNGQSSFTHEYDGIQCLPSVREAALPKRRRLQDDELEENINSRMMNKTSEVIMSAVDQMLNSDELDYFGKTTVATLRKLDTISQEEAKLEIQQILLKHMKNSLSSSS